MTLHVIYFVLISVVSPEIQGDRSKLIYVLGKLCVLLIRFSYLLLNQLYRYQLS